MLALCQGKTSLSQRGKPFRKFLLLKLLIGHCEALDPWQWYPPSRRRVLPPLCTSFLRHFVPRHCVLLSTFDSPWWTSSRRDSSLWSLARSFTNEETFILLTDRAFLLTWGCRLDVHQSLLHLGRFPSRRDMETPNFPHLGCFRQGGTWNPLVPRNLATFVEEGLGDPMSRSYPSGSISTTHKRVRHRRTFSFCQYLSTRSAPTSTLKSIFQ